MTTNFEFAQAPNRKGNQSKNPAKKCGGVTAVTRPQGSTVHPSGNQGAPAANGNPGSGRHQKVALHTPMPYCTKAENTGYIAKDGASWLK